MYYAQYEQDKFLEENVFKGFKNGFFMDIGAHDGISLNNTYYFEQSNDWKGINIEPNPIVFESLQKNRPNSMNLNVAITKTNGKADFILNKGFTEMLSGLVDTYHQEHINRVAFENQHSGSTSELIQVETKTIASICEEYNVKHIHILSIDVEGGEMNVIESIDFNKVFIDVIVFENNYEDTLKPIVLYLFEKGFQILYVELDIYMIHKDSQFNKKN